MRKTIFVCLFSILLSNSTIVLANHENMEAPNSLESILIYYDDFDIIYRTGGTKENIIDRADYIVEVKHPKMLIKIPHKKTYSEVQKASIDVRLRVDLRFSNGNILTYCFGNIPHWMQINDKYFLCDKNCFKLFCCIFANNGKRKDR